MTIKKQKVYMSVLMCGTVLMATTLFATTTFADSSTTVSTIETDSITNKVSNSSVTSNSDNSVSTSVGSSEAVSTTEADSITNKVSNSSVNSNTNNSSSISAVSPMAEAMTEANSNTNKISEEQNTDNNLSNSNDNGNVLTNVVNSTQLPEKAKGDNEDNSVVPKSDLKLNSEKSTTSVNSISFSELTAEEYIKKLLNDGSIIISNVRFTGSPKAIRTFINGLSILGIDKGVILATGGLSGTGIGKDESLGQPGDKDIESQIGLPTYDAVSIGFDFIPKYSNLSFNYIFGSREYPDFVGTQYNDAFAFFVNGINVAKVPGTDETVAINNVNSKKNSDYFIDNTDSHLGNLPTIEFGGITKVLPINTTIVPNATNHIKIVIADTGDSSLSSFVGIESGSFKSKGSITVHYVDDNNNTISDTIITNIASGDGYKTEKKEINGYVFKEVIGNPEGIFKDEDQTITYVYTKTPVTPVIPVIPVTPVTPADNNKGAIITPTNMVSLSNTDKTPINTVDATNVLPMTGETTNYLVKIVGVFLLTIVSILGLMKVKPHKEQ